MAFRGAVAAAILVAATAIVPALAAPKSTPPQASLVLENEDAALCLHNDTAWTLAKTNDLTTPAQTGDTVTWTVTATKGATSDDILEVNGFVTIRNGGSGPATIGNIVVNLQRSRTDPNGSTPPNWTGSKWISASANVADATNGDAATTANIVANASQENPAWNGAFNSPATYAVSGDAGTFTENAGSGTIEFTDADSNTIWAITPQQTIPPNGTVDLLFQATFNNTELGIAEGESVRAEVIVTFGNAGGRGGGGASASNIDVNGNGSIDADEANVRSVPARITRSVPELEECNATVTVDDLGVTTTGTVTTSDPQGFDAFPVDISDTTSWDVSVVVDGGETGGQVCNDVTLTGESSSLSVIIGYDTVTNPDGSTTQVPIYYDFVCCEGLELTDSSCVDVGVTDDQEYDDGDYCTYTKGGYAGPGAPGQLFDASFLTVFPSGLTVGIVDGTGAKHDATWTATVVGRTSLKTYLTSSAGGPNTALTEDTSNATSTSGGNLPRQTATLALNVAFNAAGVTDAVYTNFGSLQLGNLTVGSTIGSWVLTATQAADLNGTSVSQVLADANAALGGDGLPSYVGSFGDLNQLVTALNESFDNCEPSAFAHGYLVTP